MSDQRENTSSPTDHANLLALLDAVSRVEYLEVDDDKEQEQSSEIQQEDDGRISTSATETNDAAPAKTTTSPRTNKRPKKKSSSSAPTKNIFAEELMKVVADPANESIITFLPSGKEFVILDEKAFLHDVMPRSGLVLGNAGNKEGKSSIKIASFTRRLNRWGFRQIRVEGYEHCMVFTHPQFLRDEPKLCRSIKSKVGKFNGARKRLEEAIIKSKKSKRTSKKKKAVPPLKVTLEEETPSDATVATTLSRPTTPKDKATASTILPTTVPALSGNVYTDRQKLGLENIGSRLELLIAPPPPLVCPKKNLDKTIVPRSQIKIAAKSLLKHLAKKGPNTLSKNKSKTSAQLRREIPLQLRYRRLLQVQTNLQRRALLAFDAGIPSSSRPSTFIPHDAVMSATKAVTDGARLALKRDAKLFRHAKGVASPKPLPVLPSSTSKSVAATTSHATSTTASLSSSGSATPIASSIKSKENHIAVAPPAGPLVAKTSPPTKLGALEFAARRAMIERALSTYVALSGVQSRQRQNSIAGSAA